MKKTTLLKGKFVIGFENGRHVAYEDGEIAFSGDTVIFVGHGYDGKADEVIDAGLSIISPGFIDLEADIDTDHANFDVVLFRKAADAAEYWMPSENARKKDPYSDEDFSVRQRYSMAQLIKNGITTAMPIAGEQFHAWGQSCHEFSIMAASAMEMGLRVYLGPSFKSRADRGCDIDMARQDASFEGAKRFFDRYHDTNDGLIRGFMNPCQLSVTESAILQAALAFAKECGAPMRLHACEDDFDWPYTLAHFGDTPINVFERLGLLCPNLLIPHAITLKDSEIKKMAACGVTVIQTPVAEINYGAALFSFAKYRHYGVNIAIGTDAQPTDMIQNMRLSWGLDRLAEWRLFFSRYREDGVMEDRFAFEPDYPRTNAGDFFDAATINGAKALGRTDIGCLAPGAKADIIVIDLDDLRIGPYEDPLRTLLVSCVGNNVRHTIINGVFRMRDHRLIGIDEEKLRVSAQQVYEKYLGMFQTFDKHHRSLCEFCPPSLTIYKR